MRIISLVPSITELLFDLQLREEVVGLTKFCIHPRERFKALPKVGGTKQVKHEVIAELRPDLIIANREENTREDVERLRENYRVHLTDVNTVADALAMIQEVGGLTGRMREANQLSESIQLKWQALRGVAGGKRVCYAIWENPLVLAGSSTYINDVLSWCGWENAIATPRYPECSEGELRAAAPEIMMLSSEPFPFKEKHIAHYRTILPEAEIKLVDGEAFSWYGSRMLLAADELMRLAQDLE